MQKQANRLRLNRVLIALFIIFFLSVFFFPSVLNKNPQIQSKLLITAMGIDKINNEEIEFSGICILPDNGEQASIKSLTVTSSGKSIGECVENISEQYGKQVELGLCGLVVIGESTDNTNILPHLEFLLSSAYVSPGAYLIYANGGKASELLAYASEQNPSTAEILSSVVEFNDKTARITTRTLLEFLSETYSLSNSSILPSVDASKQSDNKSQSNVVSSLTTAVLYNNGQKSGNFDSEQTLGFNLATQKANKGLFVLDNLVLNGQDLGRIDCWIYSSKNKLKVDMVDDQPIAKFDINVVLQFQDQHKIIRAWKQSGKEENKITEPLLSSFQDKIKKAVLNAFTKSQELNVDIFSIKTEFYRHYSTVLDQINKDDFLKKVQPQINVKVSFK